MWNVNYCYQDINILFYSVVFVKKINLLHPHHWCFPGRFTNFSEALAGGVLWKKLFLNILQYLQESFRPATLLKRDSNTDVFLTILRNFWEHLFWRTFTNGYFCFLKKLENSGEQLFCINSLWATKPLTTQSKFINFCFVSKRFTHITYKVQSRFGNLIF